MDEDVEPVDRPLYRIAPDKRLQRDALLWVSLALIASLAAVCVVAIATGSVPTALMSATGILAAALLMIVRYAFPHRETSDGVNGLLRAVWRRVGGQSR